MRHDCDMHANDFLVIVRMIYVMYDLNCSGICVKKIADMAEHLYVHVLAIGRAASVSSNPSFCSQLSSHGRVAVPFDRSTGRTGARHLH